MNAVTNTAEVRPIAPVNSTESHIKEGIYIYIVEYNVIWLIGLLVDLTDDWCNPARRGQKRKTNWKDEIYIFLNEYKYSLDCWCSNNTTNY